MTPAMRVLRRVLFLPVDEAIDRERRLHEIGHRVAGAQRTVANAQERFDKSADAIRALTADVLQRNEEAKDQ